MRFLQSSCSNRKFGKEKFAYKEYFLQRIEVIDGKRIFIKTISCHENNFFFCWFKLFLELFLWSLYCCYYLYFRSCNVGEVFHQVFSDELVQEGLLNSLLPFLIPNKKQLQSSAGTGLSSSSLANSVPSTNSKKFLDTRFKNISEMYLICSNNLMFYKGYWTFSC